MHDLWANFYQHSLGQIFYGSTDSDFKLKMIKKKKVSDLQNLLNSDW